MKILTILFSSISTLLMLSTLLCGLWLRAQGATQEGVAFHVKLAVPTAIFALVTIGLLVFQVLKG